MGSAFVGGGDAVGDGSETAHALDSSRTKVKLTVMGLRGFILLASLQSEQAWRNSMRSGCSSAYTTHPSNATTPQRTQEVQRELWRSLTNADLLKKFCRSAGILLMDIVQTCMKPGKVEMCDYASVRSPTPSFAPDTFYIRSNTRCITPLRFPRLAVPHVKP